MPWKRITVPRTLYLPTGSPEGAFKDTGCRVEPTDVIEIQDGSGSNLIRINGTEHRLLRTTDTLRLDANNCLVLDKPQPVVISASGEGRAFVGRTGEAVRAARGNWDQDVAQRWEGDESSHVGKDWMTAQIHHAAKQGAFDDVDLGDEGEATAFDNDTLDAIDEFFTDFEAAQRKATEHTEVRPITLKDGSQGFALFDKHTGMQVGATTRQYKPVYDPDGRQSGASLGYQGPKATFNLDAEQHRRRLQAQTKDARVVAGPGVQSPAPLPPPAKPFATTSNPNLDGLLGSATGTPGLPLGSITYLAVEGGDAPHLLRVEPNATCTSLEAAFAKIHLLRIHATQRPLVLITLGDADAKHTSDGPSDQLRLLLAEQLPVLSHMVREMNKVAVVITSPLWPEDRTPTLLAAFGIPDIYLRMMAHPRDPRFLTATLIKGGQGSVTFPRG